MFIGAYGSPFFTHSFYDFSSIHNDWERSSKTFLLATHCWMRLSLSLQMSLWTKFRRYFFSLDFQQGLSTVYWDSMRRDTKTERENAHRNGIVHNKNRCSKCTQVQNGMRDKLHTLATLLWPFMIAIKRQ